MNQQTTLFSNEKLMAMIIPLFLEQLLIMLVGMADTLVVSYAGEAAVSGVSLVNQFNTIFIYLFTEHQTKHPFISNQNYHCDQYGKNRRK